MNTEIYQTITDPGKLADYIDEVLKTINYNKDGYPFDMHEFHKEEWKVIVQALRGQCGT